MKTAEEIVKALADWSNKYPRGRVYSMNKMSMDEELIEIENMAKEYANQSREEGSGKLAKVFYVIARNQEDGFEQLSVGLDSYEKAVNYRDKPFTKARYPNAFIVGEFK